MLWHLCTLEYVLIQAGNIEYILVYFLLNISLHMAHTLIDRLLQEIRNSSALATEFCLSCTNPSLCYHFCAKFGKDSFITVDTTQRRHEWLRIDGLNPADFIAQGVMNIQTILPFEIINWKHIIISYEFLEGTSIIKHNQVLQDCCFCLESIV